MLPDIIIADTVIIDPPVSHSQRRNETIPKIASSHGYMRNVWDALLWKLFTSIERNYDETAYHPTMSRQSIKHILDGTSVYNRYN